MDLDSILNSSNEGSRLQAELGTPLLLQLDGVENHLKSSLVGMEPGAFIVARTPKATGIESKLFEGNQGVVRYLWGGTVFTFQSSVLGYINQPFPLIFLSYPRVVSRVELRKETRFDCYIPSQALASNGAANGVVLDISRSGCRFQCRLGPKNNGKHLVMGQKVDLSINLGHDQEPVVLGSLIRNVKQESQSLTLGLSFDGLDDPSMGALERCIRTLQEAYDPRS